MRSMRLVAVAAPGDRPWPAAGRSGRVTSEPVATPPSKRTPGPSGGDAVEDAARATAGRRATGPRRRAGTRARGRAPTTSAWREGQRPAGRDLDLQPHEVEAGDALGHRVLDLQARVHLQEVEARRAGRAGTRPCPRSRSRPRAPPPRRPRTAPRAARRVSAGLGVSSTTFWCRRWIEHSRSSRWTTCPCRVGQHLHLDVARPLDEALEHHHVVAEGRPRLAARAGQRGRELLRAAHHAHALAAAAARGLDHHRPADARGLRGEGGVAPGRRRRSPARRARPPPPSAGARPSCRPSAGARRPGGPMKVRPAPRPPRPRSRRSG